MTQEVSSALEEHETLGAAEPIVLDAAAGDWFLREVVDNINFSDDGQGGDMTLMVAGMLVSGVLISGSRYFELLAEQFAGTLEGEERIAAMRPLLARADQVRGTPENELPSYIHLAGARMYHHAGSPIPGNQGILWRGRVRSVAGYWFGRLEIKVD